MWLGIVSSLFYVWKRSRKEGSSLWMNLDLLITGLLAGNVVYHAMLLTLESTNKLLHSLYICLAIGLLILIYINTKAIFNRNVMNQIVIRKNGIAMIAVLLLIVWGVYDSFSDHNENSNRQIAMAEMNVGIRQGNIAPNFELMNLEEKPVKLSDFAGKKVILNFWATWCPPCRVEMPQMVKFYQNNEKDAVILAINLTHTEKNQSNVRAFVEDFGLTFPVVMDAKGDVSDTYQIIAYPTSYFIDSQGIIQEVFQGAINYDMMKKAISKIN
jgi:peroxiredoxin